MKITYLITKLCSITLSLFLFSCAYAGSPLWTFTPLTATTISLSTSDTAIIQYTVTNKSPKSHTLALQTIPGISQVTTGVNCSSPFALASQESCVLSLSVDGASLRNNVLGGPKVCQANPNGTPNSNQCYQPSQADSLNITVTSAPGMTSLTVSNDTLALVINGADRVFTISNSGSVTAFSVTYSVSPSLPSGTTIAPSVCGNIAPASSCVLTVTPGATPSAAPGDTSPTPVVVTISGTNTNTLTPMLNILTYGSVYQSGYVFDINDSTPSSASISGTIVAITDQIDPSTGLIWSSNGNGGSTGDAAFNNIPGIYETSTNPPDACNGKTDGACNTTVIVDFYPGINPLYYAAAICDTYTGGGFTNWYLPAICQLGYDTVSNGSGCGTQGSPAIQNIQSNLVENGDIGSIAGEYWASTEYSPAGLTTAWTQLFSTVNSSQDATAKSVQAGVRCVRQIGTFL